MNLWNALLLGITLFVLIPMAVWSLECAAALLSSRDIPQHVGQRRPSVAVLVPAHNEEAGIRRTLDSLASQIAPGDRILVIADNCTDETARVARECGAMVVERHDPVRHGKSFALDHGVRSLAGNAPEVFIVIDADCDVHSGAIDRMARLACASGTPVQGSYILDSRAAQSGQGRITELAFFVKNMVRPSGLQRLGLPCFLNGSGMGFPAGVLRNANLSNGKIAEDKWLTADLALAGHFATFCREAKVTSRLPEQKHARESQRIRWLHGHLECVLFQGPRLLAGAIRYGRVSLLALFLDLCIPPLSLLLMLWMALFAVTAAAAMLGNSWAPFVLVAAAGTAMVASLAAVMIKFRRDGLTASFVAGPAYIFSKAPLYFAFLFRRQRKWVRTERDPVQPPD